MLAILNVYPHLGNALAGAAIGLLVGLAIGLSLRRFLKYRKVEGSNTK